MLGALVFTYGMLTSFVLSGASRNQALRRPNPPMLQAIGYLLCGLSAGWSVLLFASALLGPLPG
jgi:hypothetical protein